MPSDVSRETQERLEKFARLVKEASATQNLVAASTLPDFWERHIVDSMQLAPLALCGEWLDIGSGAGLPGMVAAIMRPAEPTLLVEPRTLRAEFLSRCVAELGMSATVQVVRARLEAVPSRPVRTISARAVAPLHRLFEIATRFADRDTAWLLPKGRTAAEELATAREAWQGDFRLVPSVTDSAARIVVARGVRPRGRR